MPDGFWEDFVFQLVSYYIPIGLPIFVGLGAMIYFASQKNYWGVGYGFFIASALSLEFYDRRHESHLFEYALPATILFVMVHLIYCFIKKLTERKRDTKNGKVSEITITELTCLLLGLLFGSFILYINYTL